MTSPSPTAERSWSALLFYDARSRWPMLTLYLKILLIWNPLATTALMLVFSRSTAAFLPRWLYSMTVGAVTAAVAMLGVSLVERATAARRRRRDRPPPPESHLRSFVLGAAFMLPGIWAGFQVARLVARAFGQRVGVPSFADYRTGIVFGLVFAGGFLLLEALRDRERDRADAALRLEQSENARLQAQIAALTAQMNPHLLFNALNTIASLIPSDPELAEDVTVRLAELYRAVLGALRRETQTLAAELDICRRYLDLEQVRFGERLRTEIAVDPAVDPARVMLPSLILHPLVENAVKYGVAPRTEGGTVSIGATPASDDGRVTIEVRDDGPGMGRSPGRPGAGTGLPSCRQRLALRFGERAVLAVDSPPSGGTTVTLTVPGGRAAGEEVSA